MLQTKSTKPISVKEVSRKWHIIDVKGQVLGRSATDIVNKLTGKLKRNYSDYMDMGDFVVVINAKEVRVTGKKELTKTYDRYSGYPGGRREYTLEQVRERKPDDLVRIAVSGMLPKNKLRDRRLARLFIFADENHPYQDKISS